MVYRQLTTEERYQIAVLRQQGLTNPQIATAVGRHRSTIDREVKRNATPYDGAYRPNMAVEMTNGRRSRSRRNARYHPIHFAPIEALLELKWSPEQIVGRRRREGIPVMSHETIYLYIWENKASGGSLWRHLRGARKQRRKRYGRYDSRGRLAGKRPIQDRPQVVAQRRRFGDWEADTVHGKGKPCIATAVERKSGLVRIGPLPGATVEHTNACLIELLSSETHPVRTITSDNGVEFHGYKQIESALDTTVYFATPHHAWERGTNENTNGLIQYAPKAPRSPTSPKPRAMRSRPPSTIAPGAASASGHPTKSITVPSPLPAGRSLPAASSSAPILGSDLPATRIQHLSTLYTTVALQI